MASTTEEPIGAPLLPKNASQTRQAAIDSQRVWRQGEQVWGGAWQASLPMRGCSIATGVQSMRREPRGMPVGFGRCRPCGSPPKPRRPVFAGRQAADQHLGTWKHHCCEPYISNNLSLGRLVNNHVCSRTHVLPAADLLRHSSEREVSNARRCCTIPQPVVATILKHICMHVQ